MYEKLNTKNHENEIDRQHHEECIRSDLRFLKINANKYFLENPDRSNMPVFDAKDTILDNSQIQNIGISNGFNNRNLSVNGKETPIENLDDYEIEIAYHLMRASRLAASDGSKLMELMNNEPYYEYDSSEYIKDLYKGSSGSDKNICLYSSVFPDSYCKKIDLQVSDSSREIIADNNNRDNDSYEGQRERAILYHIASAYEVVLKNKLNNLENGENTLFSIDEFRNLIN